MRNTSISNLNLEKRICITRAELPKYLGCGQASADKLAADAEARIIVGKRVLISVDKVRDYIKFMSK